MNNTVDKNKIITLIISLLIIGVLFFFIYKYFFYIRNNSSTTKEIDTNQLGLKYYKYLNDKYDVMTNDLIFFKSTDLDASNLDNKTILYLAYSNLSESDKKRRGQASDECFLENNIYDINTYPDTCTLESFDKKILKEQIDTLFGSNLSINYVDFKISGNQECYLKDNTYNCYLKRDAIDINNYLQITNYYKSELQDDKLIIYSYLLTVRKSSNSNYLDGIYSDANATNMIDDLSYYSTINSNTSEGREKLIDHYKDKITMYKSTFKKNNDNYIWLSTKIVK